MQGSNERQKPIAASSAAEWRIWLREFQSASYCFLCSGERFGDEITPQSNAGGGHGCVVSVAGARSRSKAKVMETCSRRPFGVSR